MNDLQAIRARLASVSIDPILALLGEYVDVGELFHISEIYDGYRPGGCIAGQAVSSAVQDLFFGGRGGVYNDVDCFAPSASGAVDSATTRNRVQTVQMAEVIGDIAYDEINTQIAWRYRVLNSSRIDTLNLVQVGDVMRKSSLELTESILKSFDLNCVQVGIDLVERRLVWTPAFERFLVSRQMEVESAHTPAHTAIRLAKKMGELKEVYLDQDRVFRTLAGAIVRLQVAEAQTRRGEHQTDRFVKACAELASNDERSAKGTLYGQRLFGQAFAQKATKHRAILEPYFELREEGLSGKVFTLDPKVLPDEPFLRLACRRHVVEYGGLASVFQRPHKPEVRARGAALLRVDPVSLEPITQGVKIWPAHRSSSLLEMAHERVSVKEMGRFLAVCNEHRGFMVRIKDRKSLAEQVAIVQIVQKIARLHGQWVYGLAETIPEVYGASLDGFEAVLTQHVAEAKNEMEKPLVHRRLRRLIYGSVKVRELVTRAECFDEGERMHHCIGGYAYSLVLGKTVLLSLRGSERDQATWSSAEIHMDEHFMPKVIQHRGPCNAPPCETNQRALKLVMEDLVVAGVVVSMPWLGHLSWVAYPIARAVLRGRSLKAFVVQGVRKLRFARSGVANLQFDDEIPW